MEHRWNSLAPSKVVKMSWQGKQSHQHACN